jgi:hypothetical protein
LGLIISRTAHRHGHSSRTISAIHDNQFEMSQITVGRVCLTLNAIATTVGPFVADWSHTHVFNPKWTPHAKFHNGQTMSMGVLLGLATLYSTWRSSPVSGGESIKAAAIFSSLYYISGISAVFYPGSLAIDPEFGTGNPQLPLFAALLGLSFLGYWLEARRLSGLKID